MSTTAILTEPKAKVEKNYLNVDHSIKSWLLTGDHKRIGIMYLVTISFFFALGSMFAGAIRLELTSPDGLFLESETYNKIFSAHGIVMVFFFLVPAVPAIFGNFLVPIMIGAKDVAFPRLNLMSYYMFLTAGILFLIGQIMGGVDTGWTFYTPYSSMYSNSQVGITIAAIFIGGFSSIFTGLNFVITIHKMRAPGMTWFRLPLFIWSIYGTSIVVILGTPVVAITLLLVVVERTMHIGIFSPDLGGDPVLFQHMFWFYSHPAVYIMVLPAFGIESELITAFARRRIFGYHFVAFSTLAISLLGFFVWGHHMFISGQSMYQGVVFSLISFLIAVPSAIKIFNWMSTLYKGNIRLQTPMIYALGFIGLFVVGGLTGLFLASIGTDVHLSATYFVIAHFHYVMVGGSVTAYLGAIHYWWPKMTGRLYHEGIARYNAFLVFIGFNLTFFPQFIVGYLGMPRRYHYYYFAPEFQAYHVMSSLGASVLAISLIVPACYLTYSLFLGPRASSNPWGTHGLEWTIASPPITANFDHLPIVTDEVYDYERLDREELLEENADGIEEPMPVKTF